MATGKIAKLIADRGFGFIREEGRREDLFFHRTRVQGVDFDDLREGQVVEFEVQPDPRDPRRIQAANVRLIGNMS